MWIGKNTARGCKEEEKWYWQLGRKEGEQQEPDPQSSPIRNLLCFFRGETDISVSGVLFTTRIGPVSKVPTYQSHPVFSCLTVNDKYLCFLLYENMGNCFVEEERTTQHSPGYFLHLPSPWLPHLYLGKGRCSPIWLSWISAFRYNINPDVHKEGGKEATPKSSEM